MSQFMNREYHRRPAREVIDQACRARPMQGEQTPAYSVRQPGLGGLAERRLLLA